MALTASHAAPGVDFGARRQSPIVVGVDDTQPGRDALAWAMSEAAIRGVTCAVVRVWNDVAAVGGARARARDTLDAAVMDARRWAGSHVDVRATLTDGPVADTLVQAATNAALLVVGSRGRSAATEAVLGSVSEECMHRAEGPIVIVPRSAHAPAGHGRITVGVDESGSSDAVVRWAAEEARLRQAELVVIHAWRLPIWATSPYGAGVAVGIEECHERGQRALARAVELVGPDQPVRGQLFQGSPSVALLTAAKQADLLVLGSRGLGPVAGIALGSTSQRCARRSPCPVVVLR